MTRSEAENILQQSFKLDRFYDERWETIAKILQANG